MHPVAFQASLHRWDLFVTLTYSSRDKRGRPLKVPTEVERTRMLFAFLRQVAKGRKTDRSGHAIERVPFRFVRWIAREERGESGGRYHWHILLEGLPPSRINRTECFVIKTIWNDCGGGFCDCRAYDTRLPGVSYVLKGLEGWSQRHANAYEMRKFGADQEDRRLILSDSCCRQWAQSSGYEGASGGTRNRKACGVRSVGGRKAAARRIKETPEEQVTRAYHNALNMHPAGVSFVR